MGTPVVYLTAATRASDRKPRGARALHLRIAATALANDLPLFTRNPEAVGHLASIGLHVHAVLAGPGTRGSTVRTTVAGRR